MKGIASAIINPVQPKLIYDSAANMQVINQINPCILYSIDTIFPFKNGGALECRSLYPLFIGTDSFPGYVNGRVE